MNNLRTSKALKFVSYILFPVFVLLIGLSIFHLAFLDEYGNTGATKFIDTEMFSSDYVYYITDNIQNAYNQKNNGCRMFMQLEDVNGNEIYYLNRDYMYSYYNGINEYVDLIIIDKETNAIYTNMRSSDYNKEIENKKNATKKATITIVAIVYLTISFDVGNVTCFISSFTSLKYPGFFSFFCFFTFLFFLSLTFFSTSFFAILFTS